jgi:small redox-active disulfide protein 2
MEIKIVGPGCANCKKLLEIVKRAVKELDLKIEIEYVTDIQKIVEMGIMQTPALAINDKVVLSGLVPDIKTVKNKIKENE